MCDALKGGAVMQLPIESEILMKRSEIPSLISQLSYQDEQQAIEYLRLWGEKKMPITTIHQELTTAIKEEREVK